MREQVAVQVALNTDRLAECFGEKCTLIVRAVCAPQDIHVKVTFERDENGDWYALTSLAVENEVNISFSWKAWRDSICRRLQGLRA